MSSQPSSQTSDNEGGDLLSDNKQPEESTIHETMERIPQLASAPPSGNAAAAFDDPLSSMLLPPPPPPPSRGGIKPKLPPNATTTTTMTTKSNFDLPPPPRVSRPPVTRTITPPPPPPPPPPPVVMTAGMPPQASVPAPPPLPPPPPPLPEAKATATPTAPPKVTNPEPQFSPAPPTAAFSEPPFLPTSIFRCKPEPRERSILARRQTHVPILIIATEAANEMAWKNGLQLADLFQGIVEEGAPSLQTMTPFRSVGRSLFLKDINVRFVTPGHFDPMDAESTASLLGEHATLREEDGDIEQDLTVLEDQIDELLQTGNDDDDEEEQKESLEQVTKEAYRLTSPLDSMPWLIRYRQGLDRTTDGLPHDLINCPPLVLLVCTATKEITEPENVLQEFYQSNHVLPNVYRKGIYDPSAMRQEVLVLHDNNDHDENMLSEKALRQLLRSRFGANAALLRINSTPHETAASLAKQETSDPWGGNGQKGTFLSENDKIVLRQYFRSLLTSALLPSLERRIADLNLIVSERKKGMRNLVKSFWRKPKDEHTGSSGTSNVYGQSTSANDDEVPYRYDSIESQTLLLADTLFLMEDYENALSTYRLIRDDYKSDKALVHYGKVLEMIALCMFQLEPHLRPREIFNTVEQALVSYTRAAEEERIKLDAKSRQAGELNIRHSTSKSSITRLATRLSLVMAISSGTIARNRYLECADLLASVSSYESSLGAAVLMEQSSVFYYKARMNRKFAFHMLMGGHMFQKCGQHHHAFRCFASAIYIYRNEMWGVLYNHLKTALVSQLFTMGRMSIALVLYAKLVGVHGGGKVSVASQQKFVQNLIEICVNHTKAAIAGSDRMLVPSSVPKIRRNSYRNEKIEQIVKIIKHTRGASRVLELPNLNLPNIAASSVKVWTKSESSHFELQSPEAKDSSGNATFGKPAKGDDKIWEELELMTTAEASAAEIGDANNDSSQEETITAALAKIDDPIHRRFIAEIDKEKQNKSLMERSRRKNKKPLPVVRARGEPIFCDFRMKNPLGIDVNFTETQLVARMVEKSSDGNKKTCTNEFAVQLNDGSLSDFQKDDWTFASTDDLKFKIPTFCRISEENVKSCMSAQVNPFFVVTKQNVSLAGEGETDVSLGIVPLVEGDLEILGVRFKLEDKVWLYQMFDIPGPLLKDTRTNIMNKVRAESVYLKSKIEVEMPCLTAELIKRFPAESPNTEADGGPMLVGQISTWTIRLRNVGTAAASGVVLKTSLPWIDIVDSEKDSSSVAVAEKESKAISHCLGPSATLMALPGGEKIDPNQTVDIEIRVRTAGDQKQDFYMLYKYDLLNEKESKRRTRWLRKMYEVPVYPSLSFRAIPLNASLKAKEILVSVELTNNRLDRPTDLYVTLDRLSLTSRKYRLELLPGQFTTSEEFGDVLQIGWQEQVTVFYKLIVPEDEARGKVCTVSECPFSESGETTTRDCASSSEANFLSLEDAFESFQSTWKSHQQELMRLENTPESEKDHPRSIASIRRANTSVRDDGTSSSERESHPTSIGSLCPLSSSPSEIHLTCSWRAILGQEVVRGEHHLRKIPIAPKSFFGGCPLSAMSQHAAKQEHDFSKTPMALVPFTVTLTNRMLETPVKFTWSWNNTAPSLELMGPCAQTLELDPCQEKQISLEALVTDAGVHNLQNISFLVHKEEGEDDETYNLSEQWLIHLVDSSSAVSSFAN